MWNTSTQLFLALLLLCSCRGIEEALDTPEGVVLPAESLESRRDMTRGVPPEFVPALEAIQQSLETNDELSARRILALLLERKPVGRTLELAQGFERILAARMRIRWLDLRLEAFEEPGVPGRFKLDLVVSQRGPEDLRLRVGGARLMVRKYAIDPDGRERRGTRRDWSSLSPTRS